MAAWSGLEILTFLKEIHARSTDPVDFDFAILHAVRESKSLTSKFYLWEMKYNAKSRTWDDVHINTQVGSSSLVLTRGTGGSHIRHAVEAWKKSSSGGTRRAIFSAFCDAVLGAADMRSGGAPQLVGLYRDGPGQKFGFVVDGQRYFLGSPVPFGTELTIEWRDRLFQRIDGTSLALVSGAPQQPRPKDV